MTVAPPQQRKPPEPDGRAGALVPWLPGALPEELRSRVRELRYVVVEDLAGQLVALSVTPWPDADGHGRVRFEPGGASDVGRGHLLVRLEELHDRLYAGWLRRDPRPGDTFAADVAAEVDARLAAGDDVPLDERLRLGAALPGVVCDITAEARNVAKLAFYAAMSGVQPFEQARQQGRLPRASRTQAKTGRVDPEPWSGPFVEADRSTSSVPVRWEVPAERLSADTGIVEAIKANPTALFYFLLNVGDGDTQLLLLPQTASHPHRRVVVVDAATTSKLPRLLDALAAEEVIPPLVRSDQPAAQDEVCALVVATHPHDDHVRGMSELLRRYGSTGIADFWEPGFYAPTGSFAEMMTAVEETGIRHCQPAAGMTRYVDGTRITVLAPSVELRTAYDTYGVECNDASIVMRVEFPAVRIAAKGLADGRQSRIDLGLPKPWALLLGADAQTRSWSHVTAEFPSLVRGQNAGLYRTLSEARGRDYLGADILKVSHHASKHGINIELVERVGPRVTLISSVGGGGKYGFPHALATDAIAEALSPTARRGTSAPRDADLGVHYTGGLSSDGTELGTVAMLVPAKRGAALRMWRFGDDPRSEVDLTAGRVLDPIRVPG